MGRTSGGRGKKREVILLSLTSPQGWSEQPETWTLVRGEERSGEESEGMRRKQHRWTLQNEVSIDKGGFN